MTLKQKGLLSVCLFSHFRWRLSYNLLGEHMQNPVCLNHLVLGLTSGAAVPPHRGNVALSPQGSVLAAQAACGWGWNFPFHFLPRSLWLNPIGGWRGQRDRVCSFVRYFPPFPQPLAFPFDTACIPTASIADCGLKFGDLC